MPVTDHFKIISIFRYKCESVHSSTSVRCQGDNHTSVESFFDCGGVKAILKNYRMCKIAFYAYCIEQFFMFFSKIYLTRLFCFLQEKAL